MKKYLLLLCLCLFSFSLFAQTDETVTEDAVVTEDEVNLKGEEYQKAETFLDLIHSMDFVMQFEPGMYMNLHSKDAAGNYVSGPSPIIFPLSIGVLWPNYTFIAIQPSLSFFSTDYLYYDGMALPAEIEHRTATSLSFMVNIPLVFTLFIRNSRFQLNGGIGGLLQFGLRSAGVDENDSGYSGSAGKDVKLINDYFWDNMHWLYLTTGVSWLYNVNSQLRFGPTFNAYIPLGALIGDQDLQGLMLTAGIKICR